MVLCDSYNDSIKRVDLKSCLLDSTVRLSSSPWEVCAIPGEQVVITLPHKGRLQLVSTHGHLKLTKRLKTKDGCRGICYCQDKLIVSFDDGTVQIMDIKGNVTREMKNDLSLFQSPWHIKVNDRDPILYISDNDTDTITKMDLELNVVAKIKNTALIEQPLSMCPLDENHLLVVVDGSYTVILLNTETQKISVLLDEEQGIRCPHCVCYSPETKQIFVTCLGNAVSVFGV